MGSGWCNDQLVQQNGRNKGWVVVGATGSWCNEKGGTKMGSGWCNDQLVQRKRRDKGCQWVQQAAGQRNGRGKDWCNRFKLEHPLQDRLCGNCHKVLHRICGIWCAVCSVCRNHIAVILITVFTFATEGVIWQSTSTPVTLAFLPSLTVNSFYYI